MMLGVSPSQLFRGIGRAVKEEYRRAPLRRIYHKYRDFTMLMPEDYVDNLIVARQAVGVEGCIVECGVWRGGMSAGLAEVLESERTYYLFDSFAGLPPAREIDGAGARAWQNRAPELTRDNCKAPLEFATQAMSMAKARSFHLVPGWFQDTLPQWEAQPIAILRLDGDWYDSTMTCLTHLYDRVVPGGLIMVDDYSQWDGCRRAVHDFLSQKKAVEFIQRRNNVFFLVRQ